MLEMALHACGPSLFLRSDLGQWVNGSSDYSQATMDRFQDGYLERFSDVSDGVCIKMQCSDGANWELSPVEARLRRRSWVFSVESASLKYMCAGG